MSNPSPPSFDQYFQTQTQNPDHRRSSTSNSYGSYGSNPSQMQWDINSHLTGDYPINDEPQLFRTSSQNSMTFRRNRAGSSASFHGEVEQRQDSFPYNPDHSTLIATAPKNGSRQGAPGQYAHQNIGGIMYDQNNQNQIFSPQPDFDQWNSTMAEQYTPYSPMPSSMGQASPYSSVTTPAPMMDMIGTDLGNGGFSGGFAHVQPTPHGDQNMPANTGEWGNDFLGNQGQSNVGDGYMSAWNGGGAEDEINEQINELVRTLSRASSHGSLHPSREPSPVLQDDSAMNFAELEQPQAHTPFSGNFGHQRHDSLRGSRSPSPFRQQGSPAFSGNAAAMGSPFMNKPQSPPALIIPNSAGSPAPSHLPSISTGAMAGVNALLNQNRPSNTSGGLAPPVNPALEHLTGISPIAPSGDGPMIYIQPSTPISAMKDSRGVFDAALRQAGQQAKQNAQAGQQNQIGQQQDSFNVPPPASHPLSRPSSRASQHQEVYTNGNNDPRGLANAMQPAAMGWGQQPYNDLRPGGQNRPRAKSDSQMGAFGQDVFDRQAFLAGIAVPGQNPQPQAMGEDGEWRSSIDHWRTGLEPDQLSQAPVPTLDPRMLPGNIDAPEDLLQQLQMSQQPSSLQAQRDRLPSLNTNVSTSASGVFKYQPGEFSPTSLAFYQSLGINPTDAAHLGGTASAPFNQTSFPNIPQNIPQTWPATAAPALTSFLAPEHSGGIGPRRKSFAEGTHHPAAGAGTPGYGVEFSSPGMPGGMGSGRVRTVSPGLGHRRAAQSEDYGKGGTGWGMGGGGSTSDFLQSITANDGSLLPPSRGRTHSRHSSVSSQRSASPALSDVSSGGSSYSHYSRMEMPESAQVGHNGQASRRRVPKMKVTSMATEVASTSRRTNEGAFKCPVFGCGSTFTRHFNLKGHLRSHNDERPYKCLYDGCPKAVVGFARQHDCKRHMLLHEGLRPFECGGCGKKFARLDALTRHHKSDQGQDCALTHPLPVNADGSPMSESQYKAWQAAEQGQPMAQAGGGVGRGQRMPSYGGYGSADERSGGEEDMGTGSGMDEYDRF